MLDLGAVLVLIFVRHHALLDDSFEIRCEERTLYQRYAGGPSGGGGGFMNPAIVLNISPSLQLR